MRNKKYNSVIALFLLVPIFAWLWIILTHQPMTIGSALLMSCIHGIFWAGAWLTYWHSKWDS